MSKIGKIKNLLCLVALYLITAILNGCATAPVVEPTAAELNAVKKFKKTLAIVDMSSPGSEIEGIAEHAESRLENSLVHHFNLVERRRLDAILNERDFNNSFDTTRLSKLGKMLGADYLLIGTCRASVLPEKIKQRSRSKDDGSFSGEVSTIIAAESELSIKIINVNSTIIEYSKTFHGDDDDEINKQRYKEKKAWENDVKSRNLKRNIKEVLSLFRKMPDEYSKVVSKSIDEVVKYAYRDIRKKFPHKGQIIEIVSPEEVMINLGSAYGTRPGDRVAVWEEGTPFRDPKTDVVSIPKKIKARLKITEVTSGLTAVAKGSPGEISMIDPGDIITLQR
ncbi:MAG: CsgG/HfaB family protein [Desulfobacteraceae bacterium]|jgi:curli biogenesis system outer membrane secretion channel CsgG